MYFLSIHHIMLTAEVVVCINIYFTVISSLLKLVIMMMSVLCVPNLNSWIGSIFKVSSPILSDEMFTTSLSILLYRIPNLYNMVTDYEKVFFFLNVS